MTDAPQQNRAKDLKEAKRAAFDLPNNPYPVDDRRHRMFEAARERNERRAALPPWAAVREALAVLDLARDAAGRVEIGGVGRSSDPAAIKRLLSAYQCFEADVRAAVAPVDPAP